VNGRVTSLSSRERWVLWLAQGFGTGRAPRAPGTVGTLPGIGFYLLLAPLGWGVYLLATLVLFALGIALCDRAARLLGRDDPPSVVWDEIVGYLVTMSAVPPSLGAIVAGFVAFRVFDIWKPGPIGWLDRRVPGGLGIMLDDLVAGLFALATLHLGRAFCPC